MATSLHVCRACQRRLLEPLVSFAGLSLTSARSQASSIRQQPSRTIRASRPFSTSIWRQQENTSTPSTAESSIPTSKSPTSEATASSSSSPIQQPTSETDLSIPWYLRVTTPTPLSPQNFPNPALQEIPPLPTDPPPILLPILTHLSISSGLDALTILDLRDLHPPSALGSNLIMILGTARSEKHLNTSADRFCRWLRNTYNLRPYADGLLGRNELKLKLRRKNKKIKLARSVGNTAFDPVSGYDDGITTGWICCNLGTVDSTEPPETEQNVAEKEMEQELASEAGPSDLYQIFSAKDQERPLEDEDEYSNPSEEDFTYRGFGSASMAPKIVVQMFTEQKRAEMDLEGLWESRIRRRDEKEQKQDRLFETTVIEEEIATPGVRRVEGSNEESDTGRRKV